MDTLFPMERIYPAGFIYTEDFISPTEEQWLYEEILKITLETFHFRGYEAKREVASFGYDYSFDRKSLAKGREIPPAFFPLIEKVSNHTGIEKDAFAELLITKYPAGSVINWHRDAPPFDVIAGISLCADCTFRLRPQDATKRSRNSVISFPVRKRSLYIIKDPARTDWQHSISPVRAIRYSITLRTLRHR